MPRRPISKDNYYEFNGIKLKTIKSSIIGKGVKTLNPIKKDTFIIRYTGKKITNKECIDKLKVMDRNGVTDFYFFQVDDDHVIDCSIGGNISMYVNHSCDPNVASESINGQIHYYALRDIDKGEELFVDYGREFFSENELTCLCGSENCFERSLSDDGLSSVDETSDRSEIDEHETRSRKKMNKKKSNKRYQSRYRE